MIVVLADGIVHSVIILVAGVAEPTVTFLVTFINVSVCVTPSLLYVLVISYFIGYTPAMLVITFPIVVTLYPYSS